MSTLYIELCSAHKNISNSIISYRAMHGNVRKVWGWSVWLLGRGVAPGSEVHELSCVKLPVWACSVKECWGIFCGSCVVPVGLLCDSGGQLTLG